MVFVTGGTGLLGSHLLFDLTAQDEPIRAIYRNKDRINQVQRLFEFYSPTDWQERFDKIEWLKGDILDIPSLEEHIDGCSKVYHCAALVSFHKRDFSKLMRINRDGTANVVNVCLAKNVDKLCYVSSTAAVGRRADQLINETMTWKKGPGTSGYSISKYSAEKEVWRGIEEGLNAVMVNPCVILGAGNWNESSLTIFKTMKNGRTFYPPGSNATVDARDVSRIMIDLMESKIKSERYLCIGSNQPFKKLMTVIANELSVKVPSKEVSKSLVSFAERLVAFIYFFLRKKPSITRETVHNLFSERAYDNSKIKEALSFEFRSLEDTISNAVKGRL